MKIHELLQEDQNPFESIKALNREFKELAAKYELTLVAGMGWPNINQLGGWFGGGLGTKGGNAKKQDSLSLPVEVRRKGFLKELAVMLEGFLAEGRPIEIAAGAQRAKHKVIAKAGSIYQQLLDNMVVAKPPGNVDREPMSCVAWFVGLPTTLAETSTLRVTVRAYGPPPPGEKWGGENLYADMGGSIDLADGKRMNALYNKFKAANSEWREWNKQTHKPIDHNANPKWFAFVRDMAGFASKVVGKALPKGFDGTRASSISIDRKILPSSAIKLSPAQLEELLGIFKKHTAK